VSDDTDRDEALLAELRALFARVDPVPPLVTETAKASLGWRRLDADLAELLSDSGLEEKSLALTRGSAAPVRSVTFSSGSLTIDMEVHADGEGRTLLGQLSPATVATIEIQTVDETRFSAQADRLGRFRVGLPAGGPIRLRVSGTGADAGPAVETSWITV
jgi:hypothetical protein